MKKRFVYLFLLGIVLIGFESLAKAKELTVIDAKIVFDEPDSKVWKVAEEQYDSDRKRGLIMFNRSPIKNPQGVLVAPVIAVVYEAISNDMDLVRYSVQVRTRVPFEVDKMFLPKDGGFTYANSLGYEGHLDQEGVKHTLLIAHMVYKNVGVQIVGDSTTDIFPQVESDMRQFMKSIQFKD